MALFCTKGSKNSIGSVKFSLFLLTSSHVIQKKVNGKICSQKFDMNLFKILIFPSMSYFLDNSVFKKDIEYDVFEYFQIYFSFRISFYRLLFSFKTLENELARFSLCVNSLYTRKHVYLRKIIVERVFKFNSSIKLSN